MIIMQDCAEKCMPPVGAESCSAISSTMRTIMKKQIALISFLLLLPLLTTNNAIAQEGITPKLIEYDVEIIIFEDPQARYINSEYWHENPDLISPLSPTESETAESNKNEIKRSNFRTIKPVILSQEYRRINNSSEFNVLFYGAWRQAGLDENKAFKIKIEDLENTHKAKSENSITGQLKLVLSRYLHIYGDLDYQRPIDLNSFNNESNDNTSGITTGTTSTEENQGVIVKTENNYPIIIHRRMRSKELHYIDHPLVGMLIQINPVKPPVENTDKTKEQ